MEEHKNEQKSPNKEGMTVQEIENFGKKYRFELAFLVYFVLASFFTFAFWGATWSIYLCGLGGVVGIWLPEKIASLASASFRFIFGQEKMTQIILAAVGVVVAIFLAPLIFLIVGLMGGMGIFHQGHKNAK